MSLKNYNSFNIQINRGDFLAQLLISPVIHPELVPLSKIAERGTGCFGSSDGQLNNIHSAESPSIFLNQLETRFLHEIIKDLVPTDLEISELNTQVLLPTDPDMAQSELTKQCLKYNLTQVPTLNCAWTSSPMSLFTMKPI